MHVVIVGPGRLGRTLATWLPEVGHAVTLCGRGDPVPVADVIWLTVPDRALAEVAGALPVRDTPVLHASGSATTDVLAPHPERGSLHPLMTFPGPEIAVPARSGLPAALDGTPGALAIAEQLATDLGFRSFRVPGDRRLYHAAAVIAGNFATVLLAEASRALVAAGVAPADAPGILAPLALTSLRNAADVGARTGDPGLALTGPVARGDDAVLDAHRAALADAGLADLLAWYDLTVTRAKVLRQSPRLTVADER